MTTHLERHFEVGDTVRLLSGEFADHVGTITGVAAEASPWTWVVRGEGWDGPSHWWATAVNDDEIERADD